ncbi:DUF397 domain-containing protein [Micromonospora sp. HUAS LYJ1]|nr:DUF397 domain-containing protein [Micromonospora sp. HUAS LYJ1]WKU03386.1 DUF397 domain-containing protein [Micromonospora sp. HUAS LYJ1]
MFGGGVVSELIWKKSSRSMAGDNNCVEVSPSTECTAVRDSKNPAAGHLRFTGSAWGSFVSAIKSGVFDGRD